MSRRTERLNAQLRGELSELISREMKDPRVSGLVSITQVEVSPDLHHARVFVSIMDQQGDEADVLRALKSAAPFLRRQLMHRLALRHVPELAFQADDSIRRGAELAQIIQKLQSGEEP